MGTINHSELQRQRSSITSKSRKAMLIIDKSKFPQAILVIDKLSMINFSDKCCGKFLMCLTRFFFYKSKCKTVFIRVFKKREQFTDSALALNKTKKGFFLIVTRAFGHRVFFHRANSLTPNTAHKEPFIAIIYRR